MTHTLRRCEQCLEGRETNPGTRLGPARLAIVTHLEDHWSAPGDRRWLSEGRRHPGSRLRQWGRQPPLCPNPADVVTTDSGPAEPVQHPPASACEPYRDLIGASLARGRNAMGIWQNLVDQHGSACTYETVKRFVRRLRGRVNVRPAFQLPTTRAPIVNPSSTSISRDMLRYVRAFPGGGFLARARYPPSRAILVR